MPLSSSSWISLAVVVLENELADPSVIASTSREHERVFLHIQLAPPQGRESREGDSVAGASLPAINAKFSPARGHSLQPEENRNRCGLCVADSVRNMVELRADGGFAAPGAVGQWQFAIHRKRSLSDRR
jgi:hypothetical protein